MAEQAWKSRESRKPDLKKEGSSLERSVWRESMKTLRTSITEESSVKSKIKKAADRNKSK